MAGRTATLLALREMLYRLCEMRMNNVLTQEQAAPLYEKTLDAMLKLANAELAQTIKTAPLSTLPAIGEALQPTAPTSP